MSSTFRQTRSFWCFNTKPIVDYLNEVNQVPDPLSPFVSTSSSIWKSGQTLHRLHLEKQERCWDANRRIVRRFSFWKEVISLEKVIDYQAINNIKKRTNAPIQRTSKMFDVIGRHKILSKVYYKTWFHQISMRPNNVKTASNPGYEGFEYLRMCTRVCNALATFQTLMNLAFHDCLGQFVTVYFDGCLILKEDNRSHYQHLQRVLSTLEKWELRQSKTK